MTDIKPQQQNGKPVKSGQEDIVNEDIRAKEVRVITENGEQLGVLQTKDAIKEAYSRDLDLVLVAAEANPPVAKMMNYSKYRYEQQKRQKEMRKNQKVIQVKEIRLSPTIEKHDFDTKVKSVSKFIQSGDKVKVTLKFFGRMIAHQEVGKKVMDDFADALNEIATIEVKPKLDGKTMFMVLAPKVDK